MLSQGRQMLLSQSQIYILYQGVSLGHKESNKTEQFSFDYSLYLHSVDWNISIRWQDYIWHFVNKLNYLWNHTLLIISLWPWIPLFARYEKWECFTRTCITNTHHVTIVQPIIQPYSTVRLDTGNCFILRLTYIFFLKWYNCHCVSHSHQ